MFSGSLICVAYTLSQDSETAQLRSACLSARVLTLCMHKLSYINYFLVNCSVEVYRFNNVCESYHHACRTSHTTITCLMLLWQILCAFWWGSCLLVCYILEIWCQYLTIKSLYLIKDIICVLLMMVLIPFPGFSLPGLLVLPLECLLGVKLE